jgi:hypothetical protein
MVFNEKIDSESKFDSVAELLPGKRKSSYKGNMLIAFMESIAMLWCSY